jgi:uncharacterized protein (DUF58 family)
MRTSSRARPDRRGRPLVPTGNHYRDRAADALLEPAFLQQLEQLSLHNLGVITTGLTGSRASARQEPLVEFTDHRAYAPGDDLRLIDWNAFSRLEELVVKTSPVEGGAALSILVDCSRSMDWGHPSRLRQAKQMAAALGAVALLRGDPVTVHGLGDGDARLAGRFHRRAALACLQDELSGLPVARTTELARSVDAYRRAGGSGTGVVLISDLLVPPGHESALDQLGPTGAVLHLTGTVENAPPAGGRLELRDRETGEAVVVAVTAGTRRRYTELVRARATRLARRCQSRSLHYVPVPATMSPAQLLFGELHQRGLVVV